MLSPFPLPPSEIPKILDASTVLLHGTTAATGPQASTTPTTSHASSTTPAPPPATPAALVLHVVVSKWGIELDVAVRCRGTYMPATKVSTGSSIAVALPGLSEGFAVSSPREGG